MRRRKQGEGEGTGERVFSLNPGCAIEKAMLVHKGQGTDDVLNKSAPARRPIGCVGHRDIGASVAT